MAEARIEAGDTEPRVGWHLGRRTARKGAVLAAQAVEAQGKGAVSTCRGPQGKAVSEPRRRCLSWEGSGSTTGRRCRTIVFTSTSIESSLMTTATLRYGVTERSTKLSVYLKAVIKQ